MGLAMALAIIPAAGCVGPQAIRSTRLKYNEAYRQTNDEQLLLNIVRLRYADSPVLIDLPTITGQFEAAALGGYNSPVSGGLDPGLPQFGVGQLTLRDSPTLSFHPREGHEITETLANPLNAEVIRIISPGADMRLFLLMAVNEVNDIPNAPLATSLVPRLPQDNCQFRELVEMFVAIQERAAAEITVATFNGDRFDPIPIAQLGAGDVLQAAKDGYVFQTSSGSAHLQKQVRSIAMRFRPEARNDPDVVQFALALGLEPGRSLYRITAEQSLESSSDDLPAALDDDSIVLNMRSILDAMTFLSKGVEVPQAHVADGTAPSTRGFDRPVHDWTEVTDGFFAVHCQKHRPKHADVAIPYRGHWFYVDRSDVSTRAVLTLLELLLELQEVETDSAAPLLTLPLG